MSAKFSLNIDKILERNKSKREGLISYLAEKGIRSQKVLDAMLKVPRELFVNPTIEDKAYIDHALPIEHNQTISQPFTVAYMTELLDVKPFDKILEIGTGSGYQAAILNVMGAKVYSIERIQELLEQAKKLFASLEYDISIKCSDGSLGWDEESPFDGILITAATPDVPKSLLEQLKVGGKLVAPIGNLELQSMNVITRIDTNKFDLKKLDQFRFVPLIGEEGFSK